MGMPSIDGFGWPVIVVLIAFLTVALAGPPLAAATVAWAEEWPYRAPWLALYGYAQAGWVGAIAAWLAGEQAAMQWRAWRLERRPPAG